MACLWLTAQQRGSAPVPAGSAKRATSQPRLQGGTQGQLPDRRRGRAIELVAWEPGQPEPSVSAEEILKSLEKSSSFAFAGLHLKCTALVNAGIEKECSDGFDTLVLSLGGRCVPAVDRATEALC